MPKRVRYFVIKRLVSQKSSVRSIPTGYFIVKGRYEKNYREGKLS